ncbi:MAG: hypothetical protein K2Q12_00260 [Rickettsiales bacterium]|nr:hypothetical protein [Rickettsiales bacterium]
MVLPFLKPSPATFGKQRILVLETTALISMLIHHQHSTQCLRALLANGADGATPFATQLVITDQVFYEVTGIMPGVQAHMLQELAAAKKLSKHQLDETIERYVRASPRAGNASSGKNELRMEVREMLRFISDYPQAWMPTVTGQCCDEKTLAEHHALSAHPDKDAMQHYRLCYNDLQSLMGELPVNAMGLHLSQLYLWGIFDRPGGEAFPKDYVDFTEKQVTHTTRDKRFVSIGTFLKFYQKVKELPANFTLAEPLNNALTPAFFIRHPELMPPIPELLRKNGATHYSIHQALGPSKLNVAQWMHLGLLPQDSEAIEKMATLWGFNAQPMDGDTHLPLFTRFQARGFYEYVPTLKNLADVAATLDVVPPALQKILDNAPGFIAQSRRMPLKAECAVPAGIMRHMTDREARVPFVGVPYEKAFAEAFISGVISWPEFMEIALQSQALIRNARNEITTRSSDITITGDIKNPEHCMLKLANHSFNSRTGVTDNPVSPQQSISIQALLMKCRDGLMGDSSQKFYRLFDALLFHAASTDALTLRDAAEQVLGIDRLARLEKDFSNRHYRKWVYVGKDGAQGGQPAFTSTFAAMTSDRRHLRKDMGELSCVEAAIGLSRTYPEAVIKIANHDNGLGKKGTPLKVAPHVRRHQRDVLNALEGLQPAIDVTSIPANLSLMNTGQLLFETSRRLGDPLHLSHAEHDKYGRPDPFFHWDTRVLAQSLGHYA